MRDDFEHQGVGNQHWAPFGGHTDDGKMALKMVSVGVVMVVAMEDEDVLLTVIVVAIG